MARYVALHQELLDDPEYESLSRDARLGWLELRLDRRVGISGTGRMTRSTLVGILGGGRRGAAVLDELTALRGGIGVEHDESSGVVWVRGAFGCDPALRSARSRAGVVAELRRLPPSPVVTGWLGRYGDRLTDAERASLDSLSIGYPPNDPTADRSSLRSDPIRSDPIREERPSEAEGLSTPAGAAPSRVDPSATDAAALARRWNELTEPPIPRIRLPLSATVRNHAVARLRTPAFAAAVDELCRRINASSFCRGEHPGKNGAKPWRAGFRWLVVNDDNWRKVLEGMYDDDERTAVSRWSPRVPDEYRAMVETIRAGGPKPDGMTPMEEQTWRTLTRSFAAWQETAVQ